MKSVLVPLKISTISLFNKHVNKETGLFDLQSFNHAVIELQSQQQVRVEPVVKPEIAEGWETELISNIEFIRQHLNRNRQDDTSFYYAIEDVFRMLNHSFISNSDATMHDFYNACGEYLTKHSVG